MTSKSTTPTSKINRIINSFERSVCNISQDIRARRQTKANTEANARQLQATKNIIKSSQRKLSPISCKQQQQQQTATNMTDDTSYKMMSQSDTMPTPLDHHNNNASNNNNNNNNKSTGPIPMSNSVSAHTTAATFHHHHLLHNNRPQHTLPPHAIEMVRNLRSISNHYDTSLASSFNATTNNKTTTTGATTGASSTAVPTTCQLPQQSANRNNPNDSNSNKLASDKSSTTTTAATTTTTNDRQANSNDEFEEEESAFATYQSRRMSRNNTTTATTNNNNNNTNTNNNNNNNNNTNNNNNNTNNNNNNTNNSAPYTSANTTNHNIIMVNMINNHNNSHSNTNAINGTLPVQPRYDQMTLRSGDKYPNDPNNAHLYRTSDIAPSQTSTISNPPQQKHQQQQQQHQIHLSTSKTDINAMSLDYRSQQSSNDAKASYFCQPAQFAPVSATYQAKMLDQSFGDASICQNNSIFNQQQQHQLARHTTLTNQSNTAIQPTTEIASIDQIKNNISTSNSLNSAMCLQTNSYQNQNSTSNRREIARNPQTDSLDQPEIKPKSSNFSTMLLASTNCDPRGANRDMSDSGVDANQIYVNAPPKPRRYQYYTNDINSSSEWLSHNNNASNVLAPEATYGCAPIYMPNSFPSTSLPYHQNNLRQTNEFALVNMMQANPTMTMPHAAERFRSNQSNARQNTMQMMSSTMVPAVGLLRNDLNRTGNSGTNSSASSTNDKSISMLQRKVLQQSSSLATQAAAAANARFLNNNKDCHGIQNHGTINHALRPNGSKITSIPAANRITKDIMFCDNNRGSNRGNLHLAYRSQDDNAIAGAGKPIQVAATIFSVPKSKSSLEARDVARFAAMKRKQQLELMNQQDMVLLNPISSLRMNQIHQTNASRLALSNFNPSCQNSNIVPSKSEFDLSAHVDHNSVANHLARSRGTALNGLDPNNFMHPQVLSQRIFANPHQMNVIPPQASVVPYIQPRDQFQFQHQQMAMLQDEFNQPYSNTLQRSKSVTHLPNQNMSHLQGSQLNILPSNMTMSQLDIHGGGTRNIPANIQNISKSIALNDNRRNEFFCSEDEEVAHIQDRKQIAASNGWRDNIHAPVMLFSDGHKHRCMTSTDIDFLQGRGFGVETQLIGSGTGNKLAEHNKQLLQNHPFNRNIIYGSHDQIIKAKDPAVTERLILNSTENIYSNDPNNNTMGNRQHRQYDLRSYNNQRCCDPNITFANRNPNSGLQDPRQNFNDRRADCDDSPIGLARQNGINQNYHHGLPNGDSHSIVDLTTPRILSTTKTILAPNVDETWSSQVGLPMPNSAEAQLRRSIRSDKTRPLIGDGRETQSIFSDDLRQMAPQQPSVPKMHSKLEPRGKQQDAFSQTSSTGCIKKSNGQSATPTQSALSDAKMMYYQDQSVACNSDIRSPQPTRVLGIVDRLSSNGGDKILRQNPAYKNATNDEFTTSRSTPNQGIDQERPSAPYYYSDLKSEDQQRALLEIQQKKSLSPPPQLLSRSLGQNKLNNSTRLMPKSAIVPSLEMADKTRSSIQTKISRGISSISEDPNQDKKIDEIRNVKVRSASLASTATIKSDICMQNGEYRFERFATSSPDRHESRLVQNQNSRSTSNITRNIDKLIEGKSISVLEEKLKEKSFISLVHGSRNDLKEACDLSFKNKLKQGLNDDIINRSRSLENVGLQIDEDFGIKPQWITSKTISCNLEKYQAQPVYENIDRSNLKNYFRSEKKSEHSSSSSGGSLESIVDLSLDTASNSDTIENAETQKPDSENGGTKMASNIADKEKHSNCNSESNQSSRNGMNLTELLERLKNNHSELTESYKKTLSKIAQTIQANNHTSNKFDGIGLLEDKSLKCDKQCENQLAIIKMIEDMILESTSNSLTTGNSRVVHGERGTNDLSQISKSAADTSLYRPKKTDKDSQVYVNVSEASQFTKDRIQGAKSNNSPTNSSDSSSLSNQNNSSSLPSSPSLNQDAFMNSNDSGFVASDWVKKNLSALLLDKSKPEIASSGLDAAKTSKSSDDYSREDSTMYENLKFRPSPDSTNTSTKSKNHLGNDKNDILANRAKPICQKSVLSQNKTLSLSARHQQSMEYKNKKSCDRQDAKSLEQSIKNNQQRLKSTVPSSNKNSAPLSWSKKSRLQQKKNSILQIYPDQDSDPDSDPSRTKSEIIQASRTSLETDNGNAASFNQFATTHRGLSEASLNGKLLNAKMTRYNQNTKGTNNKAAGLTNKRRNLDDNIDMIEFIPNDSGGFASSQFSASDFETDACNLSDFGQDQYNDSVLGNVVGVDSTVDLQDDLPEQNMTNGTTAKH